MVLKGMRYVRFGGTPFLGICSERTGGSAVIMAKEADGKILDQQSLRCFQIDR